MKALSLRTVLGPVAVGLVVLGACVPANPGSAETLQPSAVFVTRPASSGGSLALPADGWTRSDVRRYYKQRPAPPPPPIQGWIALRGGFFDSDAASENDWTIGTKATGVVGEVIQVGMSVDWQSRSGPSGIVTSTYVDPTGNVVTVTTGGLDSDSHLLPLMGVLEFHFPSRAIDPYVGAAGGWEFLSVHVQDYNTGIYYEADYDGPGYQIFGGIGFPLGQRARLTAEAFWNGATVERDVYNPAFGVVAEERIKVDGFGGRAGFNFAF